MKNIFYFINVSFQKYHVGLDSSKHSSGSKNNTFQFYKDEKHTENFVEMYSKLLNIYRGGKYILVKTKTLTKETMKNMLTHVTWLT